MKSVVEVYGKHWFATAHAPQDSLFVHEFEHQGQKIHIGALADGCTDDIHDRDYQPKLGATWLVSEFAKQAEAAYAQELREESLGRAIVLAILKGMRDYEPRYSRSKWKKGPYGAYCDELVATLYGFVADADRMVVITCGDGYLIHDGDIAMVEQSLVYPTDMIASFSEEDWPDKLDRVFMIISIDMSQISAFGIASDGLGDLGEENVKKVLEQKGTDARGCVNALFHLPIKPLHDDITVVYAVFR